MSDSINNLNFNVILHDEDFDRKIEKVKEKAKKLNSELSNILSIEIAAKEIVSSSSVQNAKDLKEQLTDIERTLKEMPKPVEATADNEKKFTENVEGANKQLQKSNDLMSELAKITGVAFGISGVRNFIGSLMRVTGEFEVQKVALTSMLQDANKENEIFGELRKNALESPYTFQDLSKYAKQITAFGIEADTLVETERRLADVAAGLGVDVGRIILAYGQVKSAGVLKGTELRQFTEAGVPLLQSLADQIERTTGKTINLAEIFDMISKKQIPFKMVEQAFREMTDAGGKFYKMQEVLVETLSGKMSKLKDVWQQALYEVGKANSGPLKGIVDRATDLAGSLDKLSGIIVSVISYFGTYAAVIGLATLAQKAMIAVDIVKHFTDYIKKIRLATAATQAFSASAKSLAGTIGLVVAALTLLWGAASKFWEAERRVTSATASYNKMIREETEKLDLLKYKLEKATKGTDDWESAKKEIVENYGQYFSGLDQEIEKVGSLETAYDNLTQSIKNSIDARAFSDFYSNEKEIYDTALDNYLASVQKSLAGRADRAVLLEKIREYIATHDIAGLEGRKGFTEFLSQTLAGTHRTGLGPAFYRLTKIAEDFQKNIMEYAERTGLGEGAMFNPEAYFNSLMMRGKKNAGGADWKPTPPKGKSPEQIRIETDIALIKDLKDAYEDLKEMGLSDDAILSAFASDTWFGKIDASLRNRTDYWEMLAEQAEKLSKYDKPASEKLLSDIGAGRAKEERAAWKKNIAELGKEQKKAEQAANAYRELIRTFVSQDTSVEGEGFLGKLSKVSSDLQTKLNKLMDQAAKAKKKLAGIDSSDAYTRNTLIASLVSEGLTEADAIKWWNTWVVGGEAAIDQLVKDGENKIAAVAKNTAEGLAKSFLDEEFFLNGIDFDNLSQRSIGQLRKLKQQLNDILAKVKISDKDKGILDSYGIDINNLADVDLDDPESNPWLNWLDSATEKALRLAKELQKAKVSFDSFGSFVAKAITKRLDNLTDEEKKALSETAKFAAQSLGQVYDSLMQFAEAAGNDGIMRAGEALQKFAKNASTVFDRLSKEDWIGAIVSQVSNVASELIDALTYTQRLQAAIDKVAEQARRESYTENLSKNVESIFGSNDLQKVRNATENLKKLRELTAADKKNDSFTTQKDVKWWEWTNIVTLGSAIIKSVAGRSEYDLASAVKDLGMSLYDEYGNLNSKALQAILDTYDDLTEGSERWLTEAINNSEAYAEAVEQIKEVMEGLFSDVASSATDSIVEQWKERKDAALDYADVLDDVATRYAKMLIQSAMLDNVLTPERAKEVAAQFAAGDHETAMGMIASDMEEIAQMAPLFEQILSAFDPYFTESESTDNSLSSGINKELVEGNSSLIASYMNGIRGDVAVTRRDIHTYLPAIAEHVRILREGSPSLSDYQAGVEAHLANIESANRELAQSNADILRVFRSVVATASTGGSAIRTAK